MKRPRMKQWVKGQILKAHRSSPDLTAKEILSVLKSKKDGARLPSLRTVQQIIHDFEHASTPEETEVRERASRLERPWRLLTLKEYELTPAAVDKILDVKLKTQWTGMTIREALWVSRLSALPLTAKQLRAYACTYAHYEAICELSGIDYIHIGPATPYFGPKPGPGMIGEWTEDELSDLEVQLWAMRPNPNQTTG